MPILYVLPLRRQRRASTARRRPASRCRGQREGRSGRPSSPRPKTAGGTAWSPSKITDRDWLEPPHLPESSAPTSAGVARPPGSVTSAGHEALRAFGRPARRWSVTLAHPADGDEGRAARRAVSSAGRHRRDRARSSSPQAPTERDAESGSTWPARNGCLAASDEGARAGTRLRASMKARAPSELLGSSASGYVATPYFWQTSLLLRESRAALRLPHRSGLNAAPASSGPGRAARSRAARSTPDGGQIAGAVVSLDRPCLGAEVFLTGKLAHRRRASHRRPPAGSAGRWTTRRSTRTGDRHERGAEASNGTLVAARARREAGIELRGHRGHRGGALIQLAVVRRLNLSDKRALPSDVGGGSTELTYLDKGRSKGPSRSRSAPCGFEMFGAKAARYRQRRSSLQTPLEGVDRVLAKRYRLLEVALRLRRRHRRQHRHARALVAMKGGHVDIRRAVDNGPHEDAAQGSSLRHDARSWRDTFRHAPTAQTPSSRPCRSSSASPDSNASALVAGVGLKGGHPRGARRSLLRSLGQGGRREQRHRRLRPPREALRVRPGARQPVPRRSPRRSTA